MLRLAIHYKGASEMPASKKQAPPPQRAGWRKRHWCESASIGLSTYDDLQDDLKPRSIKIGRRLVITESPADWLERINQAAPASLGRPRKRNAT